MISWAITVAPVGFGRGAPLIAGFVAILALGAGVAGAILLARRPPLARHLGISAFLERFPLLTLVGLDRDTEALAIAAEPQRLHEVLLAAQALGVAGVHVEA